MPLDEAIKIIQAESGKAFDPRIVEILARRYRELDQFARSSHRIERLPTEVTALGTRTVGEVTTIVNNPNHDLIPGVTVNATIISKVVPDALAIPKAALRVIQGVDGVYKLQRDHIVWTPVKAGVSDVNKVQIVSGLKQGDKVADRVIEPSDAEITNGMRVRPAVD